MFMYVNRYTCVVYDTTIIVIYLNILLITINLQCKFKILFFIMIHYYKHYNIVVISYSERIRHTTFSLRTIEIKQSDSLIYKCVI